MKLYLANPLFTLAERTFNAALSNALEADGHICWFPDRESKSIFRMAIKALDQCDILIANIDNYDVGTAFECGYVCALKKPIIQYRTSFGFVYGGFYNSMLNGSATVSIFASSANYTTRELVSKIQESISLIGEK